MFWIVIFWVQQLQKNNFELSSMSWLLLLYQLLVDLYPAVCSGFLLSAISFFLSFFSCGLKSLLLNSGHLYRRFFFLIDRPNLSFEIFSRNFWASLRRQRPRGWRRRLQGGKYFGFQKVCSRKHRWERLVNHGSKLSNREWWLIHS